MTANVVSRYCRYTTLYLTAVITAALCRAKHAAAFISRHCIHSIDAFGLNRCYVSSDNSKIGVTFNIAGSMKRWKSFEQLFSIGSDDTICNLVRLASWNFQWQHTLNIRDVFV